MLNNDPQLKSHGSFHVCVKTLPSHEPSHQSYHALPASDGPGGARSWQLHGRQRSFLHMGRLRLIWQYWCYSGKDQWTGMCVSTKTPFRWDTRGLTNVHFSKIAFSYFCLWWVDMGKHFIGIPVILKTPVVRKEWADVWNTTEDRTLRKKKGKNKSASLSPEIHCFIKPAFSHGCHDILSLAWKKKTFEFI